MGRGAFSPSRDESLFAWIRYTRRAEACATIFSRVMAPPRPLIIRSCGIDLVGAIEQEIEPPDLLEASDGEPQRGRQIVRGLAGGDAAKRPVRSVAARCARARMARVAARPVPRPTAMPLTISLTAAAASRSCVMRAASFLLDFGAQTDHSEFHGVSFSVKLRPRYCATKASAPPSQKCWTPAMQAQSRTTNRRFA